MFVLFVLLQSGAFFLMNLYFNDYISYMPIKYVIEVRLTRMVLFASYFFLGVNAYRQQWFRKGGYTPGVWLWGSASILLLLIYSKYKLVYFAELSSNRTLMAGNAVLLCAYCLSAVMASIGVFYKWANFASGLLNKLSSNSYALYYIHLPIVLSMNLVVRSLPCSAYVKYIIVVMSTLAISYFICKHFLSKTPFFANKGKLIKAKTVALNNIEIADGIEGLS